ncbi:hypothetical protein CA7LBN_003560 [Candidozyma auris]|uniref:Fatty acid hydroxylase domain-containing protein n=1 Tax=Candidozyma auris TaxID=498019 RepID=A0A8F3AIV8_CANAR|nr:hypothetical protein CA7LBN_003560 [[Candida] auris]
MFNTTYSSIDLPIARNGSSIFQVYDALQSNFTVRGRELNILEKLWMTWYVYMENDILATGLLFFVVHEISYFGRCIPWMVVDMIPFFRRWKIQPDKVPTAQEQWECFKAVLKSHFLVEALPIWLFHPLCSSLKISIGVPFPSTSVMISQIILFFICEDFWHYCAHRLFHYGWFYKNIHKQHHKYAAPFGFTAEYAHPVEVMSLGIGTVGFPILYAYIAKSQGNALPELHLFTITCWIISRLFQAVDSHSGMSRLNEYQIIGRRLPTEAVPEPKLFRMRIFAPNAVVAKSRYWYFLQKLYKVKKASGEIVALNVIADSTPTKVKTYGIWIRYESRSGIHNMYKEYRDVTRVGAVETMYQDLAARHRARFRNIHILKVVELKKTEDVKRQYVKQYLAKDLKFPLPHRVQKSKKLYEFKAPTTFY